MNEERIEISHQDLVWAASHGLVTQEHVDDLWNQLQLRRLHESRPTLSSAHVAYYWGASIVILGMSWLLGMAWSEEWGGWVVFGIASAYMAVFGYTGWYIWFQKERHIPGGLLASLAVCMVPIAIYGLQYALGLWYRPPDTPYYDPFWSEHSLKELFNILPMELGGVLAAALAFYWMPFPFLLALVASTFWYMVCDWALYAFHHWYGHGTDFPFWVSMFYGFLCVLVAMALEHRLDHSARRNAADTSDERGGMDYAFWIYTVGALAFWSGLENLWMRSEGAYLIRLVVNVGLIAISLVLKRRIFTILGIAGVGAYLFHLNDLFGGYVLFPFLITILGAAIIAIGGYRSRVADTEMTSRLLGTQEDVAQNGGGSSNTMSVALEERATSEQFINTAEDQDQLPQEQAESEFV